MKKQFIFFIVIMVLIVGSYLTIEYMKWHQYEKEYNSTEWYEVTAEYDHCIYHQERESRTDESDDIYYEDVDYYDWYYTYTAADGSVHTYVEKDHYYEPSGEEHTTILVDKYEPSHSLKQRSEETNRWSVKMALLIFLVCMLPVMGNILLTSCFRKKRS